MNKFNRSIYCNISSKRICLTLGQKTIVMTTRMILRRRCKLRWVKRHVRSGDGTSSLSSVAMGYRTCDKLIRVANHLYAQVATIQRHFPIPRELAQALARSPVATQWVDVVK